MSKILYKREKERSGVMARGVGEVDGVRRGGGGGGGGGGAMDT